ncbi:MAG TPA: Coenzyme F420 hydrogenase/dehydrogenase, beta subunit C-terminal domain [Solirubrobacteraceae bacterium]|nr:Coenzyme F420 hydrogenase/dehydrogenase, beta subunit C-terminal domain [Solirubrobacteraceae bacterium]
MPRPLQIDEIVQAGLCIGCGLCESIAGPERIALVTTTDGRERPLARAALDPSTVRAINAVCPGTRIEGAEPSRLTSGTHVDPVWGPLGTVVLGHAADPELRHRAASGGVLSALAQFMLSSGRVELVVHVAPSRQAPMRTAHHLSFDEADVLEACGSRYGPAAPLRDFGSVLARGRPFALVGKPCDVGAVRNLARVDPRVDELMRYALSMICGGASELGKSQDVLDNFGVAERDLALFRYRGHGNPGRTRIETRDGRVHELTYDEMWEDEATWRIQSRCKICPDAIGEAADIVAGDTWPNATPQGEDNGFNSILARTAAGAELLDAAVAAGAITLCGALTARQLDDFNPHQVEKKHAVGARLAALRATGAPVPRVRRLRIGRLAVSNGLRPAVREFRGTIQRGRAGRLGERAAVEAAKMTP